MALGFRGVDRDASMLLPPDLRDWLPADHLAWLVLEVVGQLDLSDLNRPGVSGGSGWCLYPDGVRRFRAA